MSIKASLNNGLTEVLKKYLPGIVPLDSRLRLPILKLTKFWILVD